MGNGEQPRRALPGQGCRGRREHSSRGSRLLPASSCPQSPPDLLRFGATAAPPTPSDTEGHIHHGPTGTAPQCNEFAGSQWSQKNIYPPQGGAAPRHPRPQVLGTGQAGLEGTWWERHLRREARSIPRADAARRHVQGVGINPLQLPSALSAGCEQIPLKLVHLQEGTRQKLSCGRLGAVGTGSTVPDPQQPHGRCGHRGAGAGWRAGAQQHPEPPSSKPKSPRGVREDAERLQSHLGTASCSRKAGFPPQKR